MDPILALISDLYSQIIALQQENAQLKGALETTQEVKGDSD